jgi:hypothetical protein
VASKDPRSEPVEALFLPRKASYLLRQHHVYTVGDLTDSSLSYLIGSGALDALTEDDMTVLVRMLRREREEHPRPRRARRQTCDETLLRLGLPATSLQQLLRRGIGDLGDLLQCDLGQLAGTERLGARQVAKLIMKLRDQLLKRTPEAGSVEEEDGAGPEPRAKSPRGKSEGDSGFIVTDLWPGPKEDK